MTMEVLAAEFPDIYQQFLDPEPSPSSGETGHDWEDNVGGDGSSVAWNMFSSIRRAAAEDSAHDKMEAVRDTNKNMKYKTVQHNAEPINRNASKPSGPTPSPSTKSIQNTSLGTSKTGTNTQVTAVSSYAPTASSVQSSGNTNTEEGTDMFPEFADIDDILATLDQLDNNQSTNCQLDLAKSAYGCIWSTSSPCLHGNSCPFTTQFLGLANFHESQVVVAAPPPRVHSVVVLRQTPNGLVKLQESLLPLGQEEVKRLQSMTPQEQVRHLGLNTAQLRHGNLKQTNGHQQLGNTSSNSTLQLREQPGRSSSTGQYTMTPSTSQYTVPMSSQYSTTSSYNTGNYVLSTSASHGQFSPVPSSEVQFTTLPNSQVMSSVKFSSSGSVPYRPPPNAVLVKVPTAALQNQTYQFSIPTPSPSPPTPSAFPATSPSMPLFCSECDTQFHDSKSLVKHTRNQHQVYQCSKCGENTVGYYRMASHTKKNHSREPAFFCQCGRNFSEKRGMTKHQNSCSFYNTQ
eukprot:GFUD01032426.1.p1 GENE.GFUD01032426.1~~GFUD01032426.1.p1  ORF type:complete len:514 (+),score=115.95 GFUD01032426.1:46-1587(+)